MYVLFGMRIVSPTYSFFATPRPPSVETDADAVVVASVAFVVDKIPVALSVPVTSAPALVSARIVVPPDCRDRLPDVSAVWTRPAEVEALSVTAMTILLFSPARL
jgi:hypothetical protein